MFRFCLKSAFLGILFFGFLSSAFAGERITSIAIEGNRYVESAAILNKLKSKVGDVMSRRQISRDVRKLFATGLFADVFVEGEAHEGGLKLVYVVVENPVVASVEVEGNDEVTRKKILPVLKIKAGRVISPKAERLDVNSIMGLYLKKGFYQAKVDVQTKALEDGRVEVVFVIDEGEITRVKEIQFIGNAHYTHEELVESLATSPSSFGSWFSDRDVFERKRFEADAQLIQQHYLEHGYLDVRIESTRLMLTPNMDDFYLSMSIHEGDAFTVSGIELQGDLVPSLEKLMEVVELEVGELYALSKLQRTLSAMTEVVGDEGFAFANVTPSFHRNIDDKTVVIVFDIEKGREVYVERVQISGNDKTKDFVVRREMRQHEGERYKSSFVRRSQERIQRLSFMEGVTVSKAQGSKSDQVNLDVNVTEGKSGRFSAGVTYSQIYGTGFTGSVSEQNLFGEGYQANVSADVGGASNNYSIGLVDPYFFRDGVSASVRLFQNQTDLQSLVAYTYKSQGGSVGLGFALNEYARYSLGYKITTTELSGVDPLTSSIALLSQVGTFTTGELTQGLSYDTRNRTVYASEGGIQSITLGYAGLTGERQFTEITLGSRNYFKLSDYWTLRAVIGGASIQGYGGVESPIYRRYSMGGVGSVRGYDSFGISLVDPATLDILGGEFKTNTSLDLIFPLPYMAKAGFRGSIFVDAGTVWGTTGTVSEVFDLAKVRASYGLGIEWASPVGPLTMVWGFPINRQINDKVRKFEFRLGQGF
ncbi:MAG TPA: outer membrane protein assembly factor BamA [Ghiorsea sp.]|nr:outer membrane protein assembly factor BamA [Ghiorsea sp.]